MKSADKFKAGDALWAGLKKVGLTPTAVLRRARLSASLYNGDKTFVTTAQFFAICDAISELNPDPATGLKLGSEVEPGHHHPAAMSALYARNYRDAIERMGRYKKLCCPEEIQTTTRRDECIIEIVWLYAQSDIPPLLVDGTFASFIQVGRYGTQTPLRPKQVELRRAPEPTGVHERFFRCPVKFRSGHDRLVLHASDLELPFVTQHADLLEMLNPQLEKALEEKSAKSVGDQVKWILKRLLSGNRPDILLVARELGMGARTLQRRITDEGVTFRQLLSEARKELAHQYLAEPSIEITEAAFLLGYDDPNAFYRAFKTWEWTTPAHWRSVRRHSIGAR